MTQKKVYIFCCLVFFTSVCGNLSAQQQEKYSPYAENGDSLIVLSDVLVYPPIQFGDEKQIMAYNRMVRDVKKTLPYAKMIYATLIETCEYIDKLPNSKAKDAHIKRVEKELFEQYKPALKKMTLTQGKLLIRMVDRECNQTSYEIAKALLGPLRAGFWNFFAGIFGASLKTSWDPDGKDAEAERVIKLVEAGVL